MNNKFYCPDIECDSCVKLIKKTLEKNNGINSIKFNKDSFEVNYNEKTINDEKIINLIKDKGFRVSLEEFERKTFKERFRDFRENKNKYEIEYKMLRYSLYSLLIIIVLELLFFFFFKNHLKYAWWIFYLDLAIISIGASMWHIKSYQTRITSMVGMMIGMTFGMQTGMMLGTILSITNGLFLGGLLGMTSAVIVGIYNGRYSGIMGIMEGMMAGLMGGLMGSMIGTMFRIENILFFMPFFMIINLFIMWGLSYMLFEEVIEENPNIKNNKISFLKFFSYCFIFILLFILIIIYGPKTGLAGAL